MSETSIRCLAAGRVTENKSWERDPLRPSMSSPSDTPVDWLRISTHINQQPSYSHFHGRKVDDRVASSPASPASPALRPRRLTFDSGMPLITTTTANLVL